MRRILVTGFDPFAGSIVNPSQLVVQGLSNATTDFCEIITGIIPTSYKRSVPELVQMIERCKPDAVLALGEFGGYATIRIERVAVNLADKSSADNDGLVLEEQPIVADGPAAYMATVPVKAMAAAAREAGVPALVSCSADTFVCNYVMYSLLHYLASSPVRAGLVHLPFCPEQTLNRNVPSLPIEADIRAVSAMMPAIFEAM